MITQEPIEKIVDRLGENFELRSQSSPTTRAIEIQDGMHRMLFHIFGQNKRYPGTAIYLLSVGLIGADFIVLRGNLGVKKLNELLKGCGKGGNLVLKHLRIMNESQHLED